MNIDILFRNARIYNVYLKKWLRRDVAVLGERVLFTGDAAKHAFEPRVVVDCENKPLIPGMIDIHLHIESTLCTPFTFARSVLPKGVTTVVSEPHEIANVFGLEGIEEMIRVSKNAPIDIFYGIPSSVPSTSPDLETTGGTISPDDAKLLMRNHKEVICLGEIMNYAALGAMEEGRANAMIHQVREESPLFAVEGHCPSVRNLELAKILYSGVDSDHCLQDPEGLRQRLEQGMFVELQEKSITDENIAVLNSCDSAGLYCFVTDDVPPDILAKDGHLDFIVRKALQAGLTLEQVVSASSWTPACRMGLRDRGAVSPGKLADLLLLKDDSMDFSIEKIYRKGKDISQDQGSSPGGETFQPRFKNSINLTEENILDEMFQLKTDPGKTTIDLLAMVKNEANTYTREGSVSMTAKEGLGLWERTQGNLVLVLDRYRGKGGFAQGYLTGCFFRNGAAASTHAHDHHNLLAAGDNKADMETAMEWVIKQQGGICVVTEGKILASVELPVGGILSEEPMETLSLKIKGIGEAMGKLGFHHRNPLMSFSTLTLPVSPSLKITDRGIIRTEEGRIMPLIR